MDTKREAEITASIKENLDVATVGRGTADRLVWLFAHLEEYLGRWIGFCNIDAIQMASVVQCDLHTLLLIGISTIEEELQHAEAASHLRKEWSQFVQLVRAINANSSKDVGRQLETKLAAVQRELVAWVQAGGGGVESRGGAVG